MTVAVPIIVPSKAKAWTATIGSLIISLLPILAEVADWIPEPYGAVLTGVGLILSALTGTATHQARYKPKGTVIVPSESVRQETGTTYPPPTDPWA